MKKLCLLLAIALLLSGCSGPVIPTEPTEGTTTVPTVPTTAPTVPTTSLPQETALQLPPEWYGCEVITPEEGVLILHGNESFQNTVIDGNVYITANAEVSFDNVWVRGNLYVHGKLTATGDSSAYSVHAYKQNLHQKTVCSAYDGIHGEIIGFISCVSINYFFTVDALDYAFETWGKVEPVEQPPKEIQSGTVGVSPIDPAQALILSGKQVLTGQTINGDVYITSDGDVNFFGVTVYGNLYVAGKLHISKLNEFKTTVCGCVYAYDFGVTCEAFDGIHGQITGEPIYCEGYVVADDALDYAFETWGKQ